MQQLTSASETQQKRNAKLKNANAKKCMINAKAKKSKAERCKW